jgi:hypothetical protein
MSLLRFVQLTYKEEIHKLYEQLFYLQITSNNHIPNENLLASKENIESIKKN